MNALSNLKNRHRELVVWRVVLFNTAPEVNTSRGFLFIYLFFWRVSFPHKQATTSTRSRDRANACKPQTRHWVVSKNVKKWKKGHRFDWVTFTWGVGEGERGRGWNCGEMWREEQRKRQVQSGLGGKKTNSTPHPHPFLVLPLQKRPSSIPPSSDSRARDNKKTRRTYSTLFRETQDFWEGLNLNYSLIL